MARRIRAGRDQYHDPDHHPDQCLIGKSYHSGGPVRMEFMSPQPPGYSLTNVVATTNLIATVTNASTGASNSVGFVGSVSQVTYFTNHTYVVAPVICGQTTTKPPACMRASDRFNLWRRSMTSLLGQYWQPVTNNYTMTLVTNSQTGVEHLQRVVTAPDFLFTAVDSGAVDLLFSRNLNFNQANILPGLAGPGTITPATTFTLNKAVCFITTPLPTPWMGRRISPICRAAILPTSFTAATISSGHPTTARPMIRWFIRMAPAFRIWKIRS